MRKLTPNKVWRRLYSFARGRSLRRCGGRFHLGRSACVDNPQSVTVGRGVTIGDYAWLNCGSLADGGVVLEIGDGCYIGRFIHVNARRSVVIEARVLIADRVFITDYHHGTANRERPIIMQPLAEPRPVRLREGCWIGEGAAIMPGVTVGRNAIVGANAVVTRDVPDHAVARGVPARMYPQDGGETLKASEN